ncbi:MAG: cation:proton antiporter [Gammaproteobacteria bacterium]|nr:cation:proton antiporter [Gammaproteobacteria bacterium]MCY3677761.1 cation:proton antiporter [Gemmatimonadota bacterium]MDE2668226.1 cation:proton antiporter [Chloroflexota bacterium]MXW66251.1 potassium transporter Kef [Candidatus Palauibacter irciniicola]MYB46450.1 potassium transporter Kef [Cenarchaeum sp. SB0662_bin_33]
MDFELIAIALGDVAWIALAFVLGLLSRAAGLPPMVGFLATGFALNLFGVASGEVLRKLSDLGITLLLFTVGLKLNLRTLARPQVWAVAGLHMSIAIVAFAAAIHLLALAGAPLVSAVGLSQSLLIAFALSFSSTVFVVKVLEEKGATASLAGRIAVGILIVQDLAAVAFLAASANARPSPWALLLLLLIPARPLLTFVLDRVGHGELLVLYSLLLALGGAELFELVGLKGDLGALVLGVLLARHHKAEEVAGTMFGFKNLFLLGFFLSIGLSGPLTPETFLVGAAITPFVLAKSALFFRLLTRFKLRARTSLRASLTLANYSEFGLIVAALGVANGWLDAHWLIVLATALSLSCAVAAVLNAAAHRIYQRYEGAWTRFERSERLADERPFDIGGARIAIIGMGRIGTAAYDHMHRIHGGSLVGVDSDPHKVRHHLSEGRNVLLGDARDGDFWDRVESAHALDVVMLALPNRTAKLAVLDRMSASAFEGRVAAAVRFPDEVEGMREAGASIVFDLSTQAGAGFAKTVTARIDPLGHAGADAVRHQA